MTIIQFLIVMFVMLISSLLTSLFIVGGIMYVVEEIEKRKDK